MLQYDVAAEAGESLCLKAHKQHREEAVVKLKK